MAKVDLAEPAAEDFHGAARRPTVTGQNAREAAFSAAVWAENSRAGTGGNGPVDLLQYGGAAGDERNIFENNGWIGHERRFRFSGKCVIFAS